MKNTRNSDYSALFGKEQTAALARLGEADDWRKVNDFVRGMLDYLSSAWQVAASQEEEERRSAIARNVNEIARVAARHVR